MRKIFYVMLISLSIVACKEKTQEIEETIDVTESEVATDEVILENTATDLQLIQGTWINIDDPRFSIVFEGSKVKNRHVGIDNETNISFTIGNNCVGTTIEASSNNKERYISTFGDTNECYKIIQLDGQNLILTYVAEGNTLSFKRE